LSVLRWVGWSKTMPRRLMDGGDGCKQICEVTNAGEGKIAGGNMFKNDPNSRSLAGKFYDDFKIEYQGATFQEKFNVGTIQISVIKAGSGFDISPYLKVN
jgi:hypothetical protein